MQISEDKLLAKLNKTKDARKRITILFKLAYLNHRTDGNKRLTYGNEAYELAESIGDLSAKVKSLSFIADAQFYLGQTQLSLQTYETAIDLADQLPEIDKVTLLIGIAHPLAAVGNMGRALEILNVALDIQQRCGFHKFEAATLLQLARVHYQLASYTKALDYSTQALLLSQKLTDPDNESRALNHIGLIYSETGQREKALATFLEECEINKSLKDDYAVSTALGNIGVLYHEMQENELSLKYYDEALQLQRANGNVVHQIYSHCNFANICIDIDDLHSAQENIETALKLLESVDYHEYAHIVTSVHCARVLNKCHQYAKALDYALQVLPLMQDGKRQEMHTMALEEIVEAYEGKGDPTNALRYEKELLAHKMHVLKLQSEADIKVMGMRQEIERKEAEKETYRNKASQLEQELKVNIEHVTRLGKEVIEKNEFLTSIKQKVQAILPTANGSERTLRSFVKEIEEQIDSGAAHQQFETALKHLHGGFVDSLSRQYPALTSTERKVCSLIKLGMNSQQMADLLFTSIRTIEGHRLNIRKKLHLEASTDLISFFQRQN